MIRIIAKFYIKIKSFQTIEGKKREYFDLKGIYNKSQFEFGGITLHLELRKKCFEFIV